MDTNDGSNNDLIVDPEDNGEEEIEAMLKEKCPVIYLSDFNNKETNELLSDIKRWET